MSEAASPTVAKNDKRSLAVEFVFVMVILAVALGLRVVFICQVHASSLPGIATPSPGTDMDKHDYIARWILDNGWFEKSGDVSPLYPYVFLPAVYKITGMNVFLAKIVQALFDTLTVFLIYLIARRTYGVRAALYAGLGAAAYAPFIIYQAQLLSESLLNLLIAAFFLVMLGVKGRMTLKSAAAAGVLLGLATAAKPTCVVFVPLAVLLVWKEASWNVRRLAAPLLTAAAACVAVLAPFAYRNYRAIGEVHLVRGNSGIMLYMGNNPDASGAFRMPRGPEAQQLERASRDMPLSQKDRLYQAAALTFIADNPRHFARLLWRKFRLFFEAPEIPNNLSVKLYRQITFLRTGAFATFGLVLPFAVAGFLISARRRNVWFLAGQTLVYAAVIIAFVVVGRYRLAVIPLILPAAGHAASEILLAITNLRFGRTVALVVLVAAPAVAVNWFALSNAATQRLHPSGIVTRTAHVVTIRDDSDYTASFSAPTMGGQSRIVKFLIVGQPLAGLKKAVVVFQTATARPGIMTVKLNDFALAYPRDVGPKEWLKVEFPPEAVEEGTNVISISGDGNAAILVYADDVYNFGRSAYSPDGTRWTSDNFDQSSFRNYAALHIGGHEFKIRLQLEYEQ